MIKASAKLLMVLSAVSIFTLQGCGQLVHTEIQKGMLTKEQPTGKTEELERITSLELLTPTTVKVFETIEFGQEFEQTFEKIQIQRKAYVDKGWILASELIIRPFATIFIFPMFVDYFNYWHWGLTDCSKSRGLTNNTVYCKIGEPERHVIIGAYVREKIYKNFTNKQEVFTSGFVSVSTNDVKRDDIAIGSDGIAALVFENYFDTFPKGEDIKAEFKYKTATVKSVVKYSQAEKNVKALLPYYQKRGADNKSAKDYIVAFKISNDPSNLYEAKNYISTKSEDAEIETLLSKYNEALDLSRFEQAKQTGKLSEFVVQYPNSQYVQDATNIIDESKYDQAMKSGKLPDFVKQNPNSIYVNAANNIIKKKKYENYVKKDCKGVVMDLREFIVNSNIYADKGKCVSIFAAQFQMTSSNAGLFKLTADHLVYIEFPTTYRGLISQGIAQIKGEYSYMTQMGTYNSVPHLRFLTEKP